MIPQPLISTLFPYTTLFRSLALNSGGGGAGVRDVERVGVGLLPGCWLADLEPDHQLLYELVEAPCASAFRSEEHTSELQSRRDLVCRLLLEKKKKRYDYQIL